MATSAAEFYALLGRRIQSARKERGYTQEALGERLFPPLTRASIANIETGKQGVLTYALVQIASVLGTTPAVLLPPLDTDSSVLGWQAELATKVPAALNERLQERLSQLPSTGGNNGRTNRAKRR